MMRGTDGLDNGRDEEKRDTSQRRVRAARETVPPPRSSSIVPPSPTMPSSGNVPFGGSTAELNESRRRPTWQEETTPITRPPIESKESSPPSDWPSQEPGSVRLPLSGGNRRLSGVRVALIDVDPTRTDALAVAMRARGAEVHISSLQGGRSHFRLLRKFAPHALLIDEHLISEEGKRFVAVMRQDPFLTHTQLIPIQMERLFRRRSGRASAEAILPMLEPLGRPEADLLSRLGPHLEVEFDLDQFPPHRLLKMLAARTAPTTITATREKETFRWTMTNGKMGRAQLWKTGNPQPQRLNPDRALEWLLSHNNCHVVLSQPAEYDDKTGREIVPIVESQESGLWALPQTDTPNAPRVDLLEAADSLLPLETENPTLVLPAARKLGKRPKGAAAPQWILAAALAILVLGAAFFISGPADDDQRTDTSVSAATPLAAPAFPIEKAPNKAREPVREEPEVAKTPPQVEAPSDPLTAFFTVQPKTGSSCEDLVGELQPPTEGKVGLADQQWRIAQRHLVQGQNEAAHVALCRSALLNPAGRGSLQLASFALAGGNLEQAERFLNSIVDEQPENVRALELRGDLLHQLGEREAAMEIWLRGLDMNRQDKAKRASVARVWVGHARTALSASDLPRAERALRRAYEFDPQSPDARSLLSEVYRRQGRAERAEQWAKLSALR